MTKVPQHRVTHPLGSLRQLRADPLGFYTGLHRRYGDLVRFRLGPHTITLVSDPKMAGSVLAGDGVRFRRGLGNDALAPILKHGVFLREGDPWARQRRTLRPYYRPNCMPEFFQRVHYAGQALAQHWTSQSGGALYPTVRSAMIALSSRLFLGSEIFAERPELHETLNALWLDLVRRQDPLRRLVEVRKNLGYRRHLRTVRESLAEAIAACKTPNEPSSLLEWIVQAVDRKTGRPLADAEIFDEAMTLIINGQECSAIATAWTLLELARAPQIQHEIVMASRAEPITSVHDALRHDLLRSTISEALRLHPPAWMLSRAAIGPQPVGAATVPANATVFISPYVIQRHPDYWTDPDRFDPLRFLRDVPRAAYLPFGSGPRTCLGMRLALSMLTVFVHAVLKHAVLEVGPGPTAPRAALTLRPDDALMIGATVRG